MKNFAADLQEPVDARKKQTNRSLVSVVTSASGASDDFP